MRVGRARKHLPQKVVWKSARERSAAGCGDCAAERQRSLGTPGSYGASGCCEAAPAVAAPPAALPQCCRVVQHFDIQSRRASLTAPPPVCFPFTLHPFLLFKPLTARRQALVNLISKSIAKMEQIMQAGEHMQVSTYCTPFGVGYHRGRQ